ncbi:AfsR/SARP family transcriptional regulator [Nocardioides sp. YIM 152315]|uniref:AfsR/SARP family transcriptional regulator n=1 Tax=Nocardioides sp. YIM 152315 TaxID=3031760 RepID=UPI0023DB8FCD|nr:AfsR/SARP family transcriptional regulator [Nocardioides sp. YIM 152315]MDF1603769.1 BTAD domain-containing putative transcriptional regulator [Nocardioides sp. YIM 152315]
MEVSVLGTVEVRLADGTVDLGTPKQRALVAALALSRGRPVSVDGIVDLLWGDDAPPGVTATLQGYVSQLRRVLEPERQRRAPATVLVTVAPGYALRVPDGDVDAHRFEQAITDVHRRLQPMPTWGASPLGEPDLVLLSKTLDETLRLWRGTPYAELGEADAAGAERARLEELRLVAVEDRAVVELALGRHATVAAELEALTSAHPLRERLWALWSVALTRSGRQAAALDALARQRTILDEELGLEPSVELRELQTAVLRQDPGLEWARPAGGVAAPATPSAVEAAPEPTAAAPPVDQVAPWPMVGRDVDLTTLLALVDRAEAGAPSYAVLSGEPGIGKSRLAAELVARVRQRGLLTLVGRCSQDDGAPPLWPWKSVLEGLGATLLDDAAGGAGDGEQFRAWERIVETIRAAARDRTVVVVLDDLHWADASTLRVLRLLVETTDLARLLVVTTWRPEPTGLLADVSESLARMHAVRVELDGLAPGEAAAVFASIASRELDHAGADALRERTDGNPFFLVELARLGSRGGDAGELPGAVTDVLNQRLARLPDSTVSALRSASVIGRMFDVETLATVTGIDEDDLIDVVEPAQAAGLVREDGIDRYLFAHALVRDTLRGGLSASRRARAHARVAEALDGARGRETEVARHWREAGPSYADRAWRAAVDAAALSRRLYAYDEAAELIRGALVSIEGDADAGLRERYDLLMALIDEYRWAAQLPRLVGAVEEAIEVGKLMRDAEAVARAAISTTQGVLWRSAPPGLVNQAVVGALRGSLDLLPPDDSALRCRAMLALANELSDTASYEERRALCDEGLAMARRLGDPVLLLDACQTVFVALWLTRTAAERLDLVTESMQLARSTGSERSFVVSACLRVAVLGELGRPAEMFAAVDVARPEVERLRIAFGETVLDGILVPWHAMAGRFEEAERLVDNIRQVASRISHNDADDSVLSSLLALRLWQGRSIEMVPALERFGPTPYPFDASLAVYLWRAGEHDRARAHFAEHGAPLEHEVDLSLLAWCHAAELALYLGERQLAADAYERIAPYAGYSCCVGSDLALGPVDAYLALAAAAVGETELATGHADAADRKAVEWGIPLFAGWFAEERRTRGF